jgi:hypothetical protein
VKSGARASGVEREVEDGVVALVEDQVHGRGDGRREIAGDYRRRETRRETSRFVTGVKFLRGRGEARMASKPSAQPLSLPLPSPLSRVE